MKSFMLSLVCLVMFSFTNAPNVIENVEPCVNCFDYADASVAYTAGNLDSRGDYQSDTSFWIYSYNYCVDRLSNHCANYLKAVVIDLRAE